jgi:hypothetical protein
MAAWNQNTWRSEPVVAESQVGESATDVVAAAARVQTALDLFAMGVEMLRMRLRRENPAWSAEELDLRIDHWLQMRRGAEGGDGQGRSVPWPRTGR